jgi:hypothetical protein
MIPALVIAGIFAVAAALDKECPRARWAKRSLLLFALVAISAGVITYLLDSGRLGVFVRGSSFRWERVAAALRGMSFGMILVLLESGQFWVKRWPLKPRDREELDI